MSVDIKTRIMYACLEILYYMISGSKVRIHFEPAQKWSECVTKVRNVGGLRECEARNNPDIGF